MKKAAKIVVFIVIGLFVVVAGLLSYVKIALPNVGPPEELKVDITPDRVKRGKYLATHVAVCIDCHSQRDWTKFAGPLDSGTIGKGGEKFDQRMGFPGEVYVPNITPHNLKSWTDGELFRAITTGVKKDGSSIFPIMPYQSYGKMDKEDIYSIMAYIRTLPEVKSEMPERKLDFPLNFIVNTMPTKADHKPVPAETDQIAYGAYLLNAAACKDCHSKSSDGAVVEGMEFAGGANFNLPSGTVYSANITPDEETGIGKWTKEQFVSRFQMYADSAYNHAKLGEKDMQTVMPWIMYGGMKTSDLEAIYAYLRTLKPVKNSVTKFVPNGDKL